MKRLCRLAEVSRSGFYAWTKRAPSARAVADVGLLDVITEIHDRSRGTYGSPRVHGQLARRGIHVGRKRVARLMREHRLVGAHNRKKWRRGRPDVAPASDRLNRQFHADRPNQKWVADICEFPTGEGKLHVARIRDLCQRGGERMMPHLAHAGWVLEPGGDARFVRGCLGPVTMS